jgi:hypothetical protein
MNFRRFDPVYQAQGKTGLTRGNKLEEAVWNDFASDPPRLNTIAYAVEANLNEQASLSDIDEVKEIVEAEEGRILTRAHLIRERSRNLVEAKKSAVLRITGTLACEACGFDFEVTYGERGTGFIEAHHAMPVHLLVPGSNNNESRPMNVTKPRTERQTWPSLRGACQRARNRFRLASHWSDHGLDHRRVLRSCSAPAGRGRRSGSSRAMAHLASMERLSGRPAIAAG